MVKTKVSQKERKTITGSGKKKKGEAIPDIMVLI